MECYSKWYSSNPVVKGKTINSLGWIITNNKIVKKYERKPCVFDIIIEIKMGSVVNMLMPYPMLGKKPPADWKIAAKQLRTDALTSFPVEDRLVRT